MVKIARKIKEINPSEVSFLEAKAVWIGGEISPKLSYFLA